MRVLIIDGQGGGIGRALIEQIRLCLPDLEILALGTNSAATASMLRAGATNGATGESAILYNCMHCDIIMGPLGILLAHSMLGEISPQIAQAVSQSPAKKVLLPISKCHAYVSGVADASIGEHIQDAVRILKRLLDA